jgi:hypothetical protein
MKYYAKQSCLKFRVTTFNWNIKKSMIYKELNSPQKANGTTVLNTVALTKGANIPGARCERSCRVCATVD